MSPSFKEFLINGPKFSHQTFGQEARELSVAKDQTRIALLAQTLDNIWQNLLKNEPGQSGEWSDHGIAIFMPTLKGTHTLERFMYHPKHGFSHFDGKQNRKISFPEVVEILYNRDAAPNDLISVFRREFPGSSSTVVKVCGFLKQLALEEGFTLVDEMKNLPSYIEKDNLRRSEEVKPPTLLERMLTNASKPARQFLASLDGLQGYKYYYRDIGNHSPKVLAESVAT